MSNLQNQPQRSSGWEKADKVATVAGNVVGGIAWVMIKVYALVLIAAGIAICVVLPASGGTYAAGGAVALYGTYLLFGGSWIIY